MTNWTVVEGRGRVDRSILPVAPRNYFKIVVSRGRYGVSVPIYRPFGDDQRHKGNIGENFGRVSSTVSTDSPAPIVIAPPPSARPMTVASIGRIVGVRGFPASPPAVVKAAAPIVDDFRFSMKREKRSCDLALPRDRALRSAIGRMWVAACYSLNVDLERRRLIG